MRSQSSTSPNPVEVLLIGGIDLPVYYNSTTQLQNSAYIWNDFKFKSEKYNDIDILIEANSHTLFDLLKIEIELEQLLHTKIDLVEFKALKKSITDQVLKECISII
jgi:predicted nucleotidyltransferase